MRTRCCLFLLTILSMSAWAHQHGPPININGEPIDTVRGTDDSHAGFGNYGATDFEAKEKLKKSCLESDLNDYLNTICNSNSRTVRRHRRRGQMSELLNTGVATMFTQGLSNYAARVMADEVRDIARRRNGGYNLRPRGNNTDYDWSPSHCGRRTNRLRRPPHDSVRSLARTVKNAVSASLIQHYLGSSSDDYEDRLKKNYPYLYQPNANAWSDIKDLLKNGNGESGDDEVEGLGAGFDRTSTTLGHENTMRSFEARYSADREFKNMIDNKVKEIQSAYARHTSDKLQGICSKNPEQIRDISPGIFNQYLADLTGERRAMANYYLCKQNWFYNPSSFDSDCDGVSDEDEADATAAADPFAPQNNWNVNSSIYANPPFGSSVNYNMSTNPAGAINITRNIRVAYDANVADAKKASFQATMTAAVADLKRKLERQFESWKANQPGFSGKTLNINFNVTYNASPNTGDFNIHNCWCSTCTTVQRAGPPQVMIPKSTCRSDFNAEQEAAIANATLNPTPRSREWWNQEDAANLRPTTDQKTIVHELGHKLGLPDEYAADYYPFNLVGEHDSFMNNGTSVKPRHIGSILSPRQCTSSGGNRVL